MKKVLGLGLITLLIMSSCKNNKNATDHNREVVIEEAKNNPTDKIGGFLATKALNSNVVNVSNKAVNIKENKGFNTFSKTVEFYGSSFPIMKGVPDGFVNEVAATLF